MTAVTAIIGAEGQLELPREVREKLGLRAGDRVRFEVGDDSITLVPQKTTLSFQEMIGLFPLPAGQTAVQASDEARHDDQDREALHAAPRPPQVTVLGEHPAAAKPPAGQE